MDSVSREAYKPAVERLDAMASGVEGLDAMATGTPTVPLAEVADEILAVADVLQGQPRLRRALSDPSRPGEDRAGLLGAVVDGKVSEAAATLLRTLVAGRWSSSTELLGATERLGVETLLASAQAANDLSDVEDELFRFGQVVDGDNELAAVLGASTVPPAQRSTLAHSLLEGKARPASVRLVDVALRGFEGRNFSSSLSRIVELAAERRDRQIAYVTVATPLSDAEETRLASRLSEMYGRPVEIKVTVNPDVLGGVSVRIGHDLYDGTVRRRLNETRTALAGRR
jgi:F-type H+-transporting ATPase subunit delta